MRRARWIAALSALALLAAGADARADEPVVTTPAPSAAPAPVASPAAPSPPTKDQCITANETGQTLRQGGKLREARAQLLVCADKACPDIVRDDCAERLNDLDRSLPTIVFNAKGAADADLATVKVTMDGAPFAERLDGAPIAVDPGEHTFELSAEGYPTQKRVLVISEGAKGRREEISFAPEAPVTPIAQAVAMPPPYTPPPPNGDTQRLIAYVLGGAGVVALGLGTYFGLRAKSTYDESDAHCPTQSGSCDPTGVELGKDAHDQATGSTIGFVAGGALLAGAVVLFFTAPSSPSSTPSAASPSKGWRGVSLRPSASASGAGLGIGGAW